MIETFVIFFIIIIAFLLGRLYQWMKYKQPEFREEIQLMIAKRRLQRKEVELREAKVQKAMNEIYDTIEADG